MRFRLASLRCRVIGKHAYSREMLSFLLTLLEVSTCLAILDRNYAGERASQNVRSST